MIGRGKELHDIGVNQHHVSMGIIGISPDQDSMVAILAISHQDNTMDKLLLLET